MSVVVTPAREGRFDASRLRIMPRGDVLLVMDRVSGRWLTLDEKTLPILPLLGARLDDLPASVLSPVTELRAVLTEHGVGIRGSERHFSELNTVILKLTNACNHACAYCYDYEQFERATTLPVALATQTLEQALDLAEDELCVILHGGEPMLLWKLVEELVQTGERLARERGKRIRYVGQTNLSRLDERIVAFSNRHAISWGVSVDGTPELHDRFRVTHQGEGTYAQFERAFDRFPAFVRRCGVMSTITAANQGHLLQIARHVHGLGMTSWDWSLFQSIGRGRAGAASFELDTDVLLGAWDVLYDAVVAGEFDGFGVLPVKKYVHNFIAGPGTNMCMRGECGAGRDLLSISASGTIEACDCVDPTGPLAGLGDLRTSTLAAARDSPVARKIRARDLSHAPCADCIWFGVCGGTCLAHAPALNDVWADGCAMAMRAFDRVSSSLATGNELVRYMNSLPQ